MGFLPDPPSPDDVANAVSDTVDTASQDANDVIDALSQGGGQGGAPPGMMGYNLGLAVFFIPSPRGVIDSATGVTTQAVQTGIGVIGVAAEVISGTASAAESAGNMLWSSQHSTRGRVNQSLQRRLTLALEAMVIALGRGVQFGSGIPVATATQVAVAIGAERPPGFDPTRLTGWTIGLFISAIDGALRSKFDRGALTHLRGQFTAGIAPGVLRGRHLLAANPLCAGLLARQHLIDLLRHHIRHPPALRR